MELYNLKNKTAIITGAAGLLGYYHAIALLELGATTILTDNNTKNLSKLKKKFSLNKYSNKVFFYKMDVTKEISVKKILEKVKSKFKSLDILINNATIDYKVNKRKLNLSRVENFSLDQWDNEINVGLKGAFICSKIFGTYMSLHNTGVILNISSDLSVISPDQRLYEIANKKKNQQPVKPVTYSVVKSGLIGLTKYFSTYWIENNIRCNALSPGGIYNGQPNIFLTRLKKLIPMSRMAQKNEYVGAIQFLCTDASKYMNGQNLIIDGGRSTW